MSPFFAAVSASLTTDTNPGIFGIGIGRIVFFQAKLLAGVVLATVIFQLTRNAWRGISASKSKLYADRFISLLFETGPSHILLKKSRVPPWFRNVYRDALLSQIHVLAGAERQTLVNHYVAMGFFLDDSIRSQSRSWWKRLTSVIRLDSLCLSQARDVFLERLQDPHPLVALGATRALSRLEGDVDPSLLFKSLERIGAGRRDALNEIISNIGFHFGPEVVSAYLLESAYPEMAIACVHVLGSLRAAPAIPVFVRALANSAHLEDRLLVEILASIRLIGDPQATAAVQQLLHHTAPAVRAGAIRALIALGDSESYQQIRAMKIDDSSIEVQRAIRELDGVAA